MRRQLPTVAALLALVLTACSTAPSGVAPTAAADTRNALKLTRNLSAEEVLAGWGEPAETRPFSVPDGTLPSEIWVYRQLVAETERQVIIGTHEIPATNPRTGQPITVNEPDYAPEVTAVTEIVEMLFVDRRLAEWKTRRDKQTRILHR